MQLKSIIVAMAIFILAVSIGCSPRSPIPYQTLQIQDSEEAQGYDVYLYVSVNPNPEKTTDANLEALLKWFEQVKYAKSNKIKVYIWGNPQSALMNNTGDLLGTINVNRQNSIYELTVRNERR
jgi:hypothetical protein